MPSPSRLTAGQAFEFGSFRFIPSQQALFDQGRPVRLGSRALAILEILIENAGDVVGKDKIIARVWPDTFVEDGNIRVHVAYLRRALRDGTGDNRFITNVSGRGYRFAASVSMQYAFTNEATKSHAPTEFQKPPSHILGRDEAVAAIVYSVKHERLVTITGMGGIGKTTVAMAVAEKAIDNYRDGVRFVNLATVTNPRLVPDAVASLHGLNIRPATSIEALLSYLTDKNILLIFDNCEHVIDAAAELAEEIVKATNHVHILTTSREPIRAAGEHVHRLPPLDVPCPEETLTAADALAFPAARLFVERAAAASDAFEFRDQHAPIVADICRWLDGVPLAIELAAAQVVSFGIAGLATVLRDRFALRMRGRRTTLPRQHTLHATLDWSYGLLSPLDKAVFRRLAIFRGPFDLAAAEIVASLDQLPKSSILDCVATLVEKSLLVADVDGTQPRYRLLEVTRLYGLGTLADSGEQNAVAGRHARYYLSLLEHSEGDWLSLSAAELNAKYGQQVDNVRTALDWAFSQRGDADVGTALTIASIPLWKHFWLLDECLNRLEVALAGLEGPSRPAQRQTLVLLKALADAHLSIIGYGAELDRLWTRAAHLAEKLDDAEHRLTAYWGLWISRYQSSDFHGALAIAQQFSSLEGGLASPADRFVGRRLLAASLHIIGEQNQARAHMEEMIKGYVAPADHSHIARFQYDQGVAAHAFYARILWLLGFADQAQSAAAHARAAARSIDHAPSLFYAIVIAACPLALLCGDAAELRLHTNTLLDGFAGHRATIMWGGCYGAMLDILEGLYQKGIERFRDSSKLGIQVLSQHATQFLAGLAWGLCLAGRTDEALSEIDQALALARRTGGQWAWPELIRVKGEVILSKGDDDGAEKLFQESLQCARNQSCLSWELRTATSLARLLRTQNRRNEADPLLRSVYDQFTEGHSTADLVAARKLIHELN